MLVQLVYTPIMLSLLGQSEYGLYTLSSSVISYLSLFTLGFGASYVRFYTRRKASGDEREVARLNGTYLTTFALMGVAALAAGLVICANVDVLFKSLTPNEQERTQVILVLLMVNLALSFPFSTVSSYITANEKFVFQKAVQIVRTISSPFIALPLMISGYGAIGYALATVVVNLAVEIWNCIYAVKKLGFKVRFDRFEKGLVKDIAAFSFFIFLNSIIDLVNTNLGKVFLGYFKGSAEVAVYGIAMTLYQVYQSISAAVSNVYVPYVNQLAIGEGDREGLTGLMTRIGRFQAFIMGLILLGLGFFGHRFIELWAGPEYSDAYYMFMIIAVPAFVPLIQNIGIEIQRAYNKHQFRSIAYSIMAVINVVISLSLIQDLGGIGVAIGTCVSIAVGNGLIMNVYYHKKLGLDMIRFWKAILRFAPAWVVSIVFGVWLMGRIEIGGLLELFAWAVVYAAVYVVAVVLMGTTRRERKTLVGFARGKLGLHRP